MSDTKKKRALVLSAFTDEGTGESFERGATPMLDAGAFANYEAAGLVSEPAVGKPVAKRKAKPKAKPAAKTVAAPIPPAPAQPADAGQTSPDT